MDLLHKLVCAVITLLVLCKSARSENECTYSLNITTGQHYQITNPSFPNYYIPGSGCTWRVTTSQGQRVKLTCDNIYMPSRDSSCKDYLAVTTTGDLRGASAFCVPFTAVGSSLKIQLISSRWSWGGIFSCDITTEEIPNSDITTVAGPNQTDNCECGWSQSSRIVGGTDAEINEFPSMVKIIVTKKRGYYSCGGTIIARRVVLTAAHCVHPDPGHIGLIVGKNVIRKSDEANRAKHLKISRVIIHPNASVSKGFNDIALLVTAADIKYTSSVGPACLPFNIKKKHLIGKYVTVTGWGYLQQNGSTSERLQKVGLQIVPDSKCASVFTKSAFIPQYHLCTQKTGKSICFGDSGSPLYYYNHQKSCHIVVGIVCHIVNCSGTKPSVQIDVHYHLPWIHNQLPDVKFCKK